MRGGGGHCGSELECRGVMDVICAGRSGRSCRSSGEGEGGVVWESRARVQGRLVLYVLEGEAGLQGDRL